MNCKAAKKFVTEKLLITLVAVGFGALVVFAGLFFGCFDLVLYAGLLTVTVPIFVFCVFLEPVWDAVVKIRLAGRPCLLGVYPALEVSAPQSFFSPSFRPPRLILA